MRKIVLQVMTTLNGRMDDPGAWLSGIPDDLYADIDRIYGTFDTVLVGGTTYRELAGYWPGAETEEGGSPINKSMARKMNAYKKFVFSKSVEDALLRWNNSERIVTTGDADLMSFVRKIRGEAGRDIHLCGGPRLVRTFVRLGLIDTYHFFVYPVVSAGFTWYDGRPELRNMKYLSSTPYQEGIVGMFYESMKEGPAPA